MVLTPEEHQAALDSLGAVRRTFEEADTDGSGALDRDEMAAVMKQVLLGSMLAWLSDC